MTTLELKAYKEVIAGHLMDLHQLRILNQKIFNEDGCILYKIFLVNAYLDFLENYLILGNLEDYYNNIIEYCALINYSELINQILKTNYKPTFLLDVSNNQSILNGGF